ncbi:hypothetical protein J7E52_05705 [Bacillus sp. ISL-34]|uniref:hypothetical protein n=1 Tax=Bacillus sp. ISL-34 TaxID=2819121 RepID=UPI001BEB0C18|nr:hypothetical protein [Bacillus sp. ISL-34]MBT2646229.1 hypothetical protein [Bacillus sp. ISL-34]
MKKDQQDFVSENMSDLVELINSKNNSRESWMYFGAIKRIKVKAKMKNEKAQSEMAWVFPLDKIKVLSLFIKQTQLSRH